MAQPFMFSICSASLDSIGEPPQRNGKFWTWSSDEQRGYLTSLVIFHCITIVLVSLALWFRTRPG